MEEGLDTGPYCLQEGVPADEKSADSMTTELADLGARLLVAALPSLADGTAVWTQQNEDEVTYAAKVTKDDVAPDPALSARENALRVRASLGAAPARILVGERGLTLATAAVADPVLELAPGAIRHDGDALALGTVDGTMLVLRVKPDGKAEMDSAAWARGAHLAPDATWRKAR
jgi:methionyl-tRNA formyltransferase